MTIERVKEVTRLEGPYCSRCGERRDCVTFVDRSCVFHDQLSLCQPCATAILAEFTGPAMTKEEYLRAESEKDARRRTSGRYMGGHP
jgi:hypothetical protein